MSTGPAGKFLAIAFFLLSGCNTTLQSGLEESEVNEVLLVLAEAGIGAEKTKQSSGSEGGWAVKVSDSELSQAWRVLRVAGLPRPRHAGFQTVYRERGLVPGKMEEQALFYSALQEEIAQTLESVEGVVSVRVHATARTEGLTDQGAPAPTASVLICYHPGDANQPPISEPAVKKIVSHAMVGLEPEQVAVVFTPKRRVVLPANEPGSVEEGNGMLKKVAMVIASITSLLAIVFIVRRWRNIFPVGRRERSLG